MEMLECGEVGANWRSRKFKVCYEMAQEFAETYRDYGGKLKRAGAQAKRKKKS
jgi:hypothetical protein